MEFNARVGFPYNRSSLAPKPMAATLVDGGLSQRVAGVGGYVLWNNLIYGEFDVYKGLNRSGLRATGQVPDDGNQTTEAVPYARIALIKDWDNHHAQIGAYALTGRVVPGGNQTFGYRNRATDIAVDANYQFIFDERKVTSDMLSAHATSIRENSSIEPGQAQALFGTPSH